VEKRAGIREFFVFVVGTSLFWPSLVPLGLGSGPVSVGENCSTHFGKLSGPFVKVRNLEAEFTQQKFRLRNQPGYRDDALYLGVEDSHHYYLIVGGKRFDGMPFFSKPQVGKGNLGSKGVIFQIPAPPELIANLEKKIETGKFRRGFSCLHALCKLLDEEGIAIEGTDKFIRSKVVSASLVRGKIKLRGKPLSPEEMEVWETAKGEVEQFVKSANSADISMAGFTVLYFAPPGVAGASIGFKVYLFLYPEQ
jgi:hypothetical protein